MPSMFQVAGRQERLFTMSRWCALAAFGSAAEVDRRGKRWRSPLLLRVGRSAHVAMLHQSPVTDMQSQDRQRSRVKHHHHVATPPAAVGSPSQVFLQQQTQQMKDIARYFDRTQRQIEEE